MATLAGQRLSRARIPEAALDLDDRDGLPARSMRRLGYELGTKATVLDHHALTSLVLLGDLVELLPAQLPILDAVTGQWTVRARFLVHSDRRQAHHHSLAFPLLAARECNTPGVLRSIDAMVDPCPSAGRVEPAAIDAFSAVAGSGNGCALLEIRSLFGATVDESSAFTAPQSDPLTAAPIHFEHRDTRFEFGLGAILSGLRITLGEPIGLAALGECR